MAGFQFVLIVLLLFSFVSSAGCLTCYACSLSNQNDKSCAEDKHMLIDSKLHMKGFVKNCSENESYCMIEKITTKYSFASYIRDCSNGHSFSYSQIDRLQGIAPNNSSRCAYYNEHLVCVTLCLGNFCNGPQEVSSAPLTCVGNQLLYFILAFLYSVHKLL
ncbi:uncharacterized protein LOC134692607 [Mytilus trossulus]|uniref:uncharacterized protein LOC134692607 n=1 Tax=Mytilus trossulus TaxID=6551 RepID=UPI003005D2F6